MNLHAWITCLALPLAVSLAAGCNRSPAAPEPASSRASRVEESSSGPVTVTLTFTPPTVRLDRDLLLNLRVSAPSNSVVTLPAIESRAEGFLVARAYDSQPRTRDGRMVLERHVRLTPKAAARYRIAPMAITWSRFGDRREQWFPTRPVLLEVEPLMKDPPASLAAPKGPFHVYPDPATWLAYLAATLLAAALLSLAWRLLRRAHRAIQLKRMSPRERALFELAELLQRKLVEKDKVKEFYFELTMIVRCYIERAHSIRAPEQTTEEFLSAVSRDSRFPGEVVNRLRLFLGAADLVKYAAFHPERSTVEQATATARNYIETDAATPPPASRTAPTRSSSATTG